MNDNLIQYVFLAKNQVFSSFFDSDILLVFLDKLIHYADSHHIAVYHKGRWFKVLMFYKNSLLQPCELQLYVFVFDFLQILFLGNWMKLFEIQHHLLMVKNV
jgi:hypothetical protein